MQKISGKFYGRTWYQWHEWSKRLSEWDSKKKKKLLLPLGCSVAEMNGMTSPCHLLAALWFMISILFSTCIIRSLSYKKFKMATTKCHCFEESNLKDHVSTYQFFFISLYKISWSNIIIDTHSVIPRLWYKHNKETVIIRQKSSVWRGKEDL